MVKYCYIVYEDGVEVYTSQLFETINDAVKFFYQEDAPKHYANETFQAGELVSYITNTPAGKPWHKCKKIRVEFATASLLFNIKPKVWTRLFNEK